MTDKTDEIVEQVIDKFRERSEKGIEKYGTTLEDNNLPFDEWLNHAQEEAMDFVVYLEKIRGEHITKIHPPKTRPSLVLDTQDDFGEEHF